MNDESSQFALSCLDGDARRRCLSGRCRPQGRLDGVLFELTLRQTYRNTSDQILEVVYTFPLPPSAVLLGFASELNGQRRTGTVVAKREAERQYEKAAGRRRCAGDAGSAHDDGLHTANIGNLKPGDELVLELRFAQTAELRARPAARVDSDDDRPALRRCRTCRAATAAGAAGRPSLPSTR